MPCMADSKMGQIYCYTMTVLVYFFSYEIATPRVVMRYLAEYRTTAIVWDTVICSNEVMIR